MPVLFTENFSLLMLIEYFLSSVRLFSVCLEFCPVGSAMIRPDMISPGRMSSGRYTFILPYCVGKTAVVNPFCDEIVCALVIDAGTSRNKESTESNWLFLITVLLCKVKKLIIISKVLPAFRRPICFIER